MDPQRRKRMTRGRLARLSQDGAHDAAIRTDGCAVCGGSKRTAEIDDHVSDFIGTCKTLQERRRTNILEEFFFERSGVRAFLRAHLRDKSLDALRSSRPSEHAVDGDAC